MGQPVGIVGQHDQLLFCLLGLQKKLITCVEKQASYVLFARSVQESYTVDSLYLDLTYLE